ncbi:hypothetical protein BDP55DRAFT_673153 [Colletotrichum godetiae]|uniref:Secreted protein n=1 Tax=Colletotrichum godetiae TaxID=1209918 RepID=A0AAJ0AEK4_9PEZI|nr:uncharacterized protein BDP55DRAFT_673153 [Colletotrichum godetiae]KAK1672446.1 hypothetical protein BDP55DRAFT_673153 [Colletotrichum godetiae]
MWLMISGMGYGGPSLLCVCFLCNCHALRFDNSCTYSIPTADLDAQQRSAKTQPFFGYGREAPRIAKRMGRC